jgi:hypothetical protein
MRVKPVNLRLALSSVLAVLALGAVTASAAQAAVEGPFYKIGGTRLAEGKSQEVKAKAAGEIRFGGPGVGPQVACSKVAFVTGAKLIGSTGANSATGEATLEMSGCQTTYGSGCKVGENGAFKSEPLKLELAYLEKTRTGRIAVALEHKKGKAFAEIKLTGGCENLTNYQLVGGISTEYIEVAGKLDEVGKEPAAAKTMKLQFDQAAPRHLWSEKGAAMEGFETELLYVGNLIEFSGAVELELTSGTTWGVFT